MRRQVLIDLLRPTSQRGDALLKRKVADLRRLALERNLLPDANAPAAKKSRSDVAARKAAAKGFVISCVKLSLKEFVTEAGGCLPFATAVNGIKRLTSEAYVFANFHLIRLLDAKISVPPLDQTFFYRCLSCVSLQSEVGDNALQESLLAYHGLRPAGYSPADRSGLRGMLQNCSQQMATAMKNHVSTQLYRRLAKHLRLRMDMDGRESYAMMKDIFADTYTGGNPVVRHFRESMPSPTTANLQGRPHAFIKVMFEIQRFNDRNAEMRGVHSFSLVPLAAGFTANYIKVCSTGLRALLVSVGQPVPAEKEFLRDEVRSPFWRRLFRVDIVETANRRFKDEILTDGKAVTVVLRREKTGSEEGAEPVLRADDYDTIWGIDPGMRDMFVGADNHDTSLRCSSAEFYNDAKFTYSNAKTKLWRDSDPAIKGIERSMPRRRSADASVFSTYIKYLLRHIETLQTFYGAQRFKNLKFLRYCASKKKLAKLCRALTARSGSRTLIGFGDWSVATASGVIKGCRPGPSTRLRRELRKYATVLDVDEFRTSKTCNCCKQRNLSNMIHRLRDGQTGTFMSKKVHSVLHCGTSGCLSATVNRDVNASRNILEITVALLKGNWRTICFLRVP